MPSEPLQNDDASIHDGHPDGNIELLLVQYVERINAGESIDPAELLANHPDCATEILDQLQAFQEIDLEFHPDPPLGTLGDYTLSRQIGRGGMGVVYEAWQGSMDRVVALKVLPPGVAADHKAFHRFMREAKTAGQLNHQNVVAVYSTGVEEGTPWYSMEYVEGETLGQVLGEIREAEPEADTPFGEKDDARYFLNLAEAVADVADGLQHAHSKGVIHRDIKPSNLILDGERRLRILDFGLAHLEGQESLTLAGDVVGTPSYMSPEQARAKKDPIDHRSDVYSLGATIYEALTLKPPFKGKDHQDTISQIVSSAPEAPHKLNPRIPQDLETIVLKCLRKDPGNRYGTAEALAQDLRRFVRGDPIEARPQSGIEKLAKRLWLYRGVLAATTLLLLLIIAGLTTANVMIARARDAARYDYYVASMHGAMEAWKGGNIRRYERLLEDHRPGTGESDLQGWEWHYLDSLRETSVLTIDGGSGAMLSIDWSHDGRSFASGSEEGAVSIWDATSGERRSSWMLDSSAVTAVSWRLDDQLLATGGSNGALDIWDVPTAQRQSSVAAHTDRRGVLSVDWSPDGKRLASSGGDATVRIWQWVDGSLIPLESFETVSQAVRCVSWGAKGRYLSAAMDWPAVLRVRETDSWDVVCESAAQSRSLHGVSWSPDGERLAIASANNTAEVWDWKLCEPIARFGGHRGVVWSVAWSPGGDLLASAADDGVVRIHDVAGGRDAVLLRGHRSRVEQVVWSPDGSRVASASQDGTLRIWDPTADPESTELIGEYPTVWSPDGKWIATRDTQEKVVRVADASTGESIRSIGGSGSAISGSVNDLAFSPDGRLLAISKPRVTHVWDWEEEVKIYEVKGCGRCAAWSPDGRWLAAARHSEVHVVEAQSGKHVRALRGHSEKVGALAWSPDGRSLATTSGRDHMLNIWDTSNWNVRISWRRLESDFEETRHNALSWRPDSQQLVAGNAAGEVIVWNMKDGTVVFRRAGHASRVKSVAWSPDGERLASGAHDSDVKIWDARTGEELLTLEGQTGGTYSLAWHPDGQRLLSAGYTPNSLKIWDATPAHEDRGR